MIYLEISCSSISRLNVTTWTYLAAAAGSASLWTFQETPTQLHRSPLAPRDVLTPGWPHAEVTLESERSPDEAVKVTKVLCPAAWRGACPNIFWALPTISFLYPGFGVYFNYYLKGFTISYCAVLV